MLVLEIAEIGEGNLGDARRSTSASDSRRFVSRPSASFSSRFHLPFSPQRKPTEPRGTTTLSDVSSIGDRLPFGIVALAEIAGEVGGAHEPVGHQLAVLLHQPHQHRHVGVLAHVVVEIRRLPVDVEFAQDDVAHGHGERRVGALLHRNPEVGELRGLGIVRADDDALRAAIARLGIEMRVRRARLRNVRAPQDEEAGIVPVGAFRNVGLLAPGLRRGRRQIAIPVVERHADAAEQRQIARARGVGDHRHRRDRREADDAVGAVASSRYRRWRRAMISVTSSQVARTKPPRPRFLV